VGASGSDMIECRATEATGTDHNAVVGCCCHRVVTGPPPG
jgi:hypothetical protein